MKRTLVGAAAAFAGGAVLLNAVAARAATVDCSTLPSPVYISGSSASKPIWDSLAPTLTGVSIIYQSPSSCVGLTEVTTAAPEPSTATYMTGAGGNNATCSNTVPAPDIGVSDVFPTSCANLTVPSGYKDFLGPIQVMLMVVPYNSTESSINYDAAYTVFGWGGETYQVPPWTQYTQIFIRKPTSGTETMIGSAIGLPSSKWLTQVPDAGMSQQEGNSTAVLNALQTAAGGAMSSAAIGILAADLGDADRGPLGMMATGDGGMSPTGGLKILAFQAKNQSCGYLPDSDATHKDKINVRQGRYDIWGPLHLVTAVDSMGNPTKAAAKTIIDTITANGLTDAAYKTLIDADAGAHVIPQCAMQVSRSQEVTPDSPGMASYQPPLGCGCYYEYKANGATYSPYCKTCNMDSDCTAISMTYPKCHFGYCEAQ
jgi:hypothetical protein